MLLGRARGCRSRSAAHFFVRYDMGNPLLRREHAPAAKKRIGGDPARGILANLRAIWHDRSSEQRRCLSVGGAVRVELFSPEPQYVLSTKRKISPATFKV